MKYSTEDLIYQGDVDKWIKLANSLRLRAAIRLSFIDPEKAKAEGELALKEALLASNADNAGVTPPQPNVWANPLLRSLVVDEARASKTMVDILQGYGAVPDPRLTLILSKAKHGYKGKTALKSGKEFLTGCPLPNFHCPNMITTTTPVFGDICGDMTGTLPKKAITSQSPKPTQTSLRWD